MKYIFGILAVVLLLTGCSNTWRGVKQDTKEAGEWTKDKVHSGAEWVEKKTE